MAEGNINFNNYASWDMPVWMNRLNPIPLDKTTLFSSLSEAETYATNRNLAYIGQVITVVEGENVTVYKINADRTLTSLATSDSINASGSMVWVVSLEDESGNTYFSETDASGNTVTENTPGAQEVLKLSIGDSTSYVANLVDLRDYLTRAEAAATYVTKTEFNELITITGDDTGE